LTGFKNNKKDISVAKSKTDKENSLNIDTILKQLDLYKSFFDNYIDGVMIVDPENLKVIDSNENAAMLFNSTKFEFIGSVVPQFKRIIKLLKKDDSPYVLSEISMNNSDNESIMVEVSSRFIDFENKKLVQAVVRNISEQFQLTDRLVQSDKLVLLGQLIASVAHEIRNPLAAINLNLQLLQRKSEADTVEANQVQTALQGVERISKIIEATLNFSRSNSPEVKNVNVNDVLPKTLEMYTSSLKKKQINLDMNFGENLPNVFIDEKHLLQVFVNLIKNAIDAIDQKGEINVKTYIEESSDEGTAEFVVISVSDSGCGIHPDDFSRIFNPFFTKKEDGTGLGLPISQRIIHQYNGNIDMESILGIGTTVYIKLPPTFD
jgi:signal transduction histidine kinase